MENVENNIANNFESILVRRAIAAYYRSNTSMGKIKYPEEDSSSMHDVFGRGYIVLRSRRCQNEVEIVAVYRIAHGMILKRLKRYPKELEFVPNGYFLLKEKEK